MKKQFCTIAIIALLTSLTAAAQSEQSPNHSIGPYIEGNFGTNLYALGIVSSDGAAGSAGLNGYAWNAAVGYKLRSWFALEGGFTQSSIKVHSHSHHHDYDDDSYYYSDHSSKRHSYFQHINAPYLSTRFTVPINPRFSFIGKAGLMYAYTTDKEHDDSDSVHIGAVLPYLGIGAGYALTPQVDLSVQYQGALYALVNAGVLTGGVTYHF